MADEHEWSRAISMAAKLRVAAGFCAPAEGREARAALAGIAFMVRRMVPGDAGTAILEEMFGIDFMEEQELADLLGEITGVPATTPDTVIIPV